VGIGRIGGVPYARLSCRCQLRTLTLFSPPPYSPRSRPSASSLPTPSAAHLHRTGNVGVKLHGVDPSDLSDTDRANFVARVCGGDPSLHAALSLTSGCIVLNTRFWRAGAEGEDAAASEGQHVDVGLNEVSISKRGKRMVAAASPARLSLPPPAAPSYTPFLKTISPTPSPCVEHP
jgi:hypothetical protein